MLEVSLTNNDGHVSLENFSQIKFLQVTFNVAYANAFQGLTIGFTSN